MQKIYIIDDFSDPNEITKITDPKVLDFLRKASTIPTGSSNVSFEEYIRIIQEEFNENKQEEKEIDKE